MRPWRRGKCSASPSRMPRDARPAPSRCGFHREGTLAPSAGLFVAFGPLIPPRGAYDAPVEHLTPRQREVLQAIAAGDSISEAAYRLHLSHGYTKNLAAQARHRLDARSTTQACCEMIRREAAGRS